MIPRLSEDLLSALRFCFPALVVHAGPLRDIESRSEIG